MRRDAINMGFSVVPFGLPARAVSAIGRGARAVARPIGNFFAPRNVGVHHTLYGRGADAALFPPWNTPRVKPSGIHGTTAGDQIPGMSYMWGAGGRGGASAAAREAQGQTSLMFNNMMLEPGTQGVGKVVTTPRFAPRPDPNLPGTRAAMVQGPQLRVTGEVASRSGPLTSADTNLLSSMVNRQKIAEAARSAGRIGSAVGAGSMAQNTDMAALRQMLR